MHAVIQGKHAKSRPFVYDIFKGVIDTSGKIVKVRTLGTATLNPGSESYHVQLYTFLEDQFFLLPESKEENDFDYAILSREPARNPDRKFFWHQIGEGRILPSPNGEIMALDWDAFGGGNIYMNLVPFKGPSDMMPFPERQTQSNAG